MNDLGDNFPPGTGGGLLARDPEPEAGLAVLQPIRDRSNGRQGQAANYPDEKYVLPPASIRWRVLGPTSDFEEAVARRQAEAAVSPYAHLTGGQSVSSGPSRPWAWGPYADDPDRGAGFFTILRAGLAPTTEDQIKRFAAARYPGMPLDRAVKSYNVIDGNIVYADENGRYVREIPSVMSGGLSGAFMRAGDHVASQVGGAAPAVAGATVGALAAPSGTSIPLAGVAAGVTDLGRSALDRWLANESITGDDLISAGRSALEAGAGQAVALTMLTPLGRTGVPAQSLKQELAELTRLDREQSILKFVSQGFSPKEARYLAEPYVGMGHHYWRRAGITPWEIKLPKIISYSPFNVLKPAGINRGDFYELHYKVDPHYKGSGLGYRGRLGSWSGDKLGLEKYGRLGRLWHGAPMPLKFTVGGVGGGVGGAAY